MEFLDEAAVRERISLPELIRAQEEALRAFSAGRVLQPPRRMIGVEEHSGVLGLMPALWEGVGADGMGVKLVTFYPDNERRGLHTHHALIVVFDPSTGVPRSVMDGRLITELRTAAVSAAATALLARETTPVLAILGSGVQASAHVEALRCVRSFEEIRVWSRNREHAERFAERIGGRALPAEEAVRGAQVVVTATAATRPILEGSWLEPGAHVNAVGWNGVSSRELDDDAMAHPVFVESREAAMAECGDVRLSGASITAELGEALARPDPAWREQTTIFESVGMAIEDLAAARLVLEADRERKSREKT